MKNLISSLLLSLGTFLVHAGEISSPKALPSTYIFIEGGAYEDQYHDSVTRFIDGVLFSERSFNDGHSNGYGQVGLGTGSRIGCYEFDHQLSLSKLFGKKGFFNNSQTTYTTFEQVFDFGYDLMPKFSISYHLNAYGLIGGHYARFYYNKIAGPETTAFDLSADEFGLNLGAGLNYQWSECMVLGINTNICNTLNRRYMQQTATSGSMMFIN